MELFHASNQWSTRPADERFSSLEDLYRQTKAYADTAKENLVPYAAIRAEVVSGQVQLVGKAGNPALLTHWSFNQLASRVGAPGAYLGTLPPTLAVQNLNYGLKRVSEERPDDSAKILFHQNGSLLARAFTSEKYERIWNYEVAERLIDTQKFGWKPALPTMAWGADPTKCILCSGTGHKHSEACTQCKGTGKAQPALFASDHDMFAFVVNESSTVREPNNPNGLRRGIIVTNSEVGSGALKLMRFYFRDICGNFIIWGASQVMSIRVRHVGNARERWAGYQAEMKAYLDSSASLDEQRIAAAQTMKIGDSKEQVLDLLFGKRSIGVSYKVLEAGYDATVPALDGSPNTVWGMMQGLTRHSQTLQFADERNRIDVAAGKLMEAVF